VLYARWLLWGVRPLQELVAKQQSLEHDLGVAKEHWQSEEAVRIRCRRERADGLNGMHATLLAACFWLLAENQRLCPNCHGGVEDVAHMMFDCHSMRLSASSIRSCTGAHHSVVL
jgi:hypothetical protein